MREYNPVCGVGYKGDIPIRGNECAYTMWLGMLHACYGSEANKYITVKTIDERWHLFKNFLEDLPSLEGYSKKTLIMGTYVCQEF